MRNLTKSIAAMSILAPASAYSLGIGDIKLHSALNQNLNAEIALLVSSGEKVSEINIRLAPPEKFDEAGVPWNYFLSKIKFESVTKADGTVVVKLSSNEALREPYLDFLLEVSWPKGNLYREFTVLVDPPAAYTQPIVPVIEKAVQEQEVVPTEVELEAIETVAENVKPMGQYGPTNSSDYLWKIAEQTNAHSDVSVEQMMIAIYEANPKAFYKENVNALKAGETLDIPEKEVVLRLSKKQARSEFKRQNNVWNGSVVAKAQKSVDDPEKNQIITQLELKAPVDEEVIDAAIITESKPIAEPVAEQQVENNEKIAVESNDQTLALQARLEKLEEQLLMMQKMMALKDEQLAALQVQENSTKTPAENKATVVEIDPGSKPPVAQNITTMDNAVSETAVDEEKPVEEEKVAKQSPVAMQPEAESDWLTPILSAVGIIILGLLGWMWARKRKIENETDTESMFARASEISLPDTTEDSSVSVLGDSSSYDVGTVGESSFLSEFTPSDFDAFDTDQNEVDPVSEADVYLAYGRYQQAEDLMRQAIIDQPERDECKLKLLEIFYANENKTAFEEYATELVNSGLHNNQEFWGKVVEMGAEIAPDSSLFSAQTDTKADFDLSEDSAEDVNSDENGLTEQLSVDTNDINESDDASDAVDFDLSIFDENDSKESDDVSDLDFDLSVFDSDDSVDDDIEENDLNEGTNDSLSLDEAGNDVQKETIESLDFNKEDNSDIELPAEDIADEISIAATELGEEIENVEFSLESGVGEDSVSVSGESKVELDDIESFDFDFNTADVEKVDASPSNALDSLDSGVSDLTDMDELETKIDLAKAYIDMGDAEAAKSIAEEVMEKGNEEQKVAAQVIIDQLK